MFQQYFINLFLTNLKLCVFAEIKAQKRNSLQYRGWTAIQYKVEGSRTKVAGGPLKLYKQRWWVIRQEERSLMFQDIEAYPFYPLNRSSLFSRITPEKEHSTI